MPNTYTLLETVTVGAAGASSVTFNSIPQTGYTDLIIKISARSTGGGAFTNMVIAFNGSSANYTLRWLGDANGGAVSYTQAAFGSNHLFYIPASGATANTFGNGEITIPNYTSSNFKSLSADGANENNASTIYQGLSAGLWSQTAAITSLTLSGGGFAQHSSFSLYGVSALGVTPTIAPKAAGGSIIQTDGTYWYHAFLSSGTFTPATAISCDVLVVAGGGSGGAGWWNGGGGGGAGGIFYATSQTVSTAQTVTVGGGGAAANGSGGTSPSGSNGSDSQFGSLTLAKGGGYGGGAGTGVVGSGGSGGGAGGNSSSASGGATIQTGTGGTGYGNAGGGNDAYAAYGGGGGAGAAGANATGGVSGLAGAGRNTWSSWLSPTGLGVSGYIAGGGAAAGSGQAGGLGGGGTGGNWNTSGPAGAGVANTGSGGGGAGSQTAGFNISGAGGSGLVIVRYPVAF